MGYMTFVKRMVANLFKPPVTSPYPLQPRTPLPVDRGHIVNPVSYTHLTLPTKA